MKAYCIGNVIDDKRYEVTNPKIAQIIENGFVMGSMNGPIERNPLVGFDIILEKFDILDVPVGKVKGMLLQKIVMNSMKKAFLSIDVEVKEPKMSFELSLYK